MTTQTQVLLPRKQRREEARNTKTKFVPQYNFGEFDMQENGQPLKVQHKDVAKSERNEARRNNKSKK